jgi:hypothetical protein
MAQTPCRNDRAIWEIRAYSGSAAAVIAGHLDGESHLAVLPTAEREVVPKSVSTPGTVSRVHRFVDALAVALRESKVLPLGMQILDTNRAGEGFGADGGEPSSGNENWPGHGDICRGLGGWFYGSGCCWVG